MLWRNDDKFEEGGRWRLLVCLKLQILNTSSNHFCNLLTQISIFKILSPLLPTVEITIFANNFLCNILKYY